jgi:hypothetical protein
MSAKAKAQLAEHRLLDRLQRPLGRHVYQYPVLLVELLLSGSSSYSNIMYPLTSAYDSRPWRHGRSTACSESVLRHHEQMVAKHSPGS